MSKETITITKEELDAMINKAVEEKTATVKKAFPEIWKKEGGYQIAIPIALVEEELAKTKAHNSNLKEGDKEWKKVTWFTKYIFNNRK